MMRDEQPPVRSQEKAWGQWPSERTAEVVQQDLVKTKGSNLPHDVFAAVAAGRNDILEVLLQWAATNATGTFLTQYDSLGRNALHVACERGNTAALKGIVNALHDKASAAAVRTRCRQESYAFDLALRYNHPECARFLLEVGMANLKGKRADDFSALHLSALYGYVDIIQTVGEALSAAADAEAVAPVLLQDVEGRTPLMVSCWIEKGTRRGKATEFLAAKIKEVAGADALNARDRQGYRAIDHAACYRHGYPAALKALLDAGADATLTRLRTSARDWTTLVHVCARKNTVDMLESFLKAVESRHGEEAVKEAVNALDSEGLTPLHAAARTGAVDAVALLLRLGAVLEAPQVQDKVVSEASSSIMGKVPAAVVGLTAEWPVTPLSMAVTFGHSATVHALLKAGAKADGAFDSSGTNILTAALTRFVLAQRGIICRPPENGRPTCDPAYTQEKLEFIAIANDLLEHGLDVSRRDRFGLTALHGAAMYSPDALAPLPLPRDEKLAKEYIAKAGTPEARRRDGRDLFDRVLAAAVAAAGADLVNASSTLQASTQAFAQTGRAFTRGITALHCAAQCGHLHKLKTLIEAGARASLSVRDEEGDTPLHQTAISWLYDDTQAAVQYLLSVGADPTARNRKNKTPFEEYKEFETTLLVKKSGINRKTQKAHQDQDLASRARRIGALLLPKA